MLGALINNDQRATARCRYSRSAAGLRRALLCNLSLNEKKTCQDRAFRYAARSLFSIGPMSYTFRWSAEGSAERLYC